jgi:multiple sugar transport system permease protein
MSRAKMDRGKENQSYIKWIFVLPMLIFFFMWNMFPIFWALGLSFYKFSVLRGIPPKFVGLSNYTKFFNDPYFWSRFRITFTYAIMAVFLEFLIGFALGFLFNKEIKGKKIMLTLMMAPMMIAPAAVGVFFRFMYEPTWGIIPYFCDKLFGVRPKFLIDPTLALRSVILVDVWMWSPFILMMTLAGLQAVPQHLLEAAEIDRLSWWMKIRYIILPTIKPILILAVLLRTMDAFRIFDTIYIMTAGGPGTKTEVISISLYRLAFSFFHNGKASALAIILFVITIIFTSLFLALLKKKKVSYHDM